MSYAVAERLAAPPLVPPRFLSRPNAASSAGPEAVERAARLADAHDFIRRLPEGYRTRVGEQGVALSGGQRQRIAIARAIVDDPPILLLDEPTSALDVASERSILRSLERAMANRSTLMVTHRPSMARGADRVLVVRDGRIEQQGTHQRLCERSAYYRALQGLPEPAAASGPAPSDSPIPRPGDSPWHRSSSAS